jgi:hypothetical protein
MSERRPMPTALGPGRLMATTIRAAVGSEYLMMSANWERR